MRIRSLDGLRGLAAVIVLVHHALLTIPILAEPYVSKERTGDPVAGVLLYTPLHFFWEGRAAVYVFFILSGVVLTLPVVKAGAFSWAAYYPQRLIRLYLPVWAAVVLAVLWMLAVRRDDTAASSWLQARPRSPDAESVIRDLTLVLGHGGNVSPLWSLRWEIWFSLLLPAFVFIGVRLARIWWAVVVASLGAIAVSGVVDDPALTYLPMFMIGVAIATVLPRLSEADVHVSGRVGWPLLAASVVLMIGPWLAQWAFGARVTPGPLTAVATIGALGLVFCALVFDVVRRVLETPVLQWLGVISFSLYLVHEPVVISFAYLFGDDALAAAIIVGVVVSVVLAWGFHLAVEVPSHRLARRVGGWVKKRRDEEPSDVERGA